MASDTIHVSNCPTCGHFPTQFIQDGDKVTHRALPLASDSVVNFVEQMDMLLDDFRKYSDGARSVPFVTLRDSLVATLNEYESVRDRLAALDGGWRPIEEAPKHKRVLVRDAEGDMDVAWWSEQDKCWVVRLLLNEDPIVCTPTHYLPNESLPAPPEGA
jgi:hypothetical protein